MMITIITVLFLLSQLQQTAVLLKMISILEKRYK